MGPYGARGSSGAPPPHSLHAPHVGVGASVPRSAAPHGRPHNLWGPPTAPLCGVAGRITAPEPNPEWGGEEEEGVKMRVVMMMVMMKMNMMVIVMMMMMKMMMVVVMKATTGLAPSAATAPSAGYGGPYGGTVGSSMGT